MADNERSPTATSAGGDAVKSIPGERVFLVVVDDTDEMKTALYYASRRALRTGGRVAMLYVIEPPEFQHWLGVERVMQQEAREQAEQTLQMLAQQVTSITGKIPVLHLREGGRREEVLAQIDEDPSISILVLGTAIGREDPGPLVTYLISRMGDRMKVPVMLVPGHLTEADIDLIT